MDGTGACVGPLLSHFGSGYFSLLWLGCVSVLRLVLMSCPHLLPPPQYKAPPLGMPGESVYMVGWGRYGEEKESVLERIWM